MTSRFIRAYRVARSPAAIAKRLAYNARCKVDFGTDETRFDYSKRTDHFAGGTIFPKTLSATQHDRVSVWQALEKELRGNVKTVATSLIATLPRDDELKGEERIALVEAFCTPIRNAGHIVDWQIHQGRKGNWHVHILFSNAGMKLDDSIKPLHDSPFLVDWRTINNDRHAITPPWQRLWRVIQDHFFLDRAINLRVPASTMRLKAEPDKPASLLKPAASGAYASSEKIQNWRAHRSELFSDPILYAAALTRDRLLIDNQDRRAFDAMVWGADGPPPTIVQLFNEEQNGSHDRAPLPDQSRAIRVGGAGVSFSEPYDLLIKAMKSAQNLASTPFMTKHEIAGLSSPDAARLAGTGSIASISARSIENIIRFKQHFKFYPGILPALADLESQEADCRRISVFVIPDHIAHRQYAKALKGENRIVIGLHKFLKGDLLKLIRTRFSGRALSIMLSVIDAQRISERMIARLICTADALRKNVSALKLLLLKPADVMAEPIAPLVDWVARSFPHFFIRDRITRTVNFGSDSERNAVQAVSPYLTLKQGYSSFNLSVGTESIPIIPLPYNENQSSGRHERYAVICDAMANLPRRYRQIVQPKIPLIVVGSRHSAGWLSNDSIAVDTDDEADRICGDGFDLCEGDRAFTVRDLNMHGRKFPAGTVVEICFVKARERVFWFRLPNDESRWSVAADQASNFLPLDIVPVREGHFIEKHINDILGCGIPFHPVIVIDDAENAGRLMKLADRFYGRTTPTIFCDSRIAKNNNELKSLIDRSPLADAIDAIARQPHAPHARRTVKPAARIDAMPPASETAGSTSNTKKFVLDWLPKPVSSVRPRLSDQSRVSSETIAPHADSSDFEDDFGGQELADTSDADRERDREDDPDDLEVLRKRYENDGDDHDPGR